MKRLMVVVQLSDCPTRIVSIHDSGHENRVYTLSLAMTVWIIVWIFLAEGNFLLNESNSSTASSKPAIALLWSITNARRLSSARAAVEVYIRDSAELKTATRLSQL